MAGIYFNLPDSSLGGGIDEYTKLMLHMDGDYVDDSDSNHIISTAGDPTFDPTIKKFGSHSVHLDGGGDYLGVADSEDWNFSDGDFTIDCWIYLASGVTVPIYSQLENIGTDNNRIIYGFWSNSWNFYARTTSILINATVVDSVPATSEWIHVALTRSGDDFRFFKNGNQIGTTHTDTSAVPNNIGPIRIGSSRLSATFPVVMNGRVDEFRISKGIARWTGNFTPKNVPYSI